MASRFHIPHALPRQKTCRERYTSFLKYCLRHTKVRNILNIVISYMKKVKRTDLWSEFYILKGEIARFNVAIIELSLLKNANILGVSFQYINVIRKYLEKYLS